MADWDFWAVALAIAVGSVLVLLTAVLRAMRGESSALGPSDLAVYKDQLAEIARDLQRGTLTAEEAERLRAEIGRRVLEADRTGRTDAPLAPTRAGLILPVILLGLTLPGAVAAYWVLGAPGYPDMALEPRLSELDQAIATRPSQDVALATLGRTRDPALDARLAGDLATITDPAKLRDLFSTWLQAGDTQAAVRCGERLIAVLGEASDAADHANLALALVIEAEGYVSPEAESQLRESLARDMSNELARYLVGEMFLQGGRYDKAFSFWRPIAETGDPARPWVASIRERIADVAGLAGVRYALPESASGPSAADMAAAAEMTPEDRQAMIEGMVAQLSDRLASEGGPVEDWDRLIRSLVVLERQDEAQRIYDEAKTRFAGREAELSMLEQAAVESGLRP